LVKSFFEADVRERARPEVAIIPRINRLAEIAYASGA
jgi:hypothetical protein